MNRCPSVRTRAKVDRSLSSEARLLWRCSDSVLAWRLGAEARDQLQHPGLAALGALWRPFLQAVVFADRDAYLKVLATRLALELIDSHDSPPLISAPSRQRLRHSAPRPPRAFRRATHIRQFDSLDGTPMASCTLLRRTADKM